MLVYLDYRPEGYGSIVFSNTVSRAWWMRGQRRSGPAAYLMRLNLEAFRLVEVRFRLERHSHCFDN